MKSTILLIATLLLVALRGWQEPLHTLSGAPVSLTELRGRVVVLAFGGSSIPLFSRELASLQRLATRYESRRVAVYWVSIDSDQPGHRQYASNAQLQSFLKRSNLRLEVLRDPEMAAYRSFGLEAVPTIVLLDQSGRLVRRYVGIGTDQGEVHAELIEEIEKLIRQ
jgi:peroxiredoxin